jgi:multiple sugar transport system ATP-binding protein
VYNLPANRFVATVIGNPPTNFIPCRSHRGVLEHPLFEVRLPRLPKFTDPDRVALGIRPEHISISLAPTGEGSIPAEVFVIEPLGAEVVVDLNLSGTTVKALVPSPFEGHVGQTVWVHMDPLAVNLLDEVTGYFVAYGASEPMTLVNTAGVGTSF